ncbi:hypothetical protein [Profundibacter sp.]
MSAYNFPSEDYAISAMQKIHSVMSVLSTSIDLSDLDGVTVSFDYNQSLLDLDRGYESTHKLQATIDVAIGVAMAPRVIREGKLKSHLVLNAEWVLGIIEESGEETDHFSTSLHLLAHECAHVEVTKVFETSFPNRLLRHTYDNILDSLRWQTILAAWDEYAVCRIVAKIGYDPTQDYLETLRPVLSKTRSQCMEEIKRYRTSGDGEKAVIAVYGAMGNLLKYSSYFLGSLRGAGHNLNEFHDFQEQLNNSWFCPFFERLVSNLDDLYLEYGEWNGFGQFEQLGDIIESMAEEVGVFAERGSNQDIHFSIS